MDIEKCQNMSKWSRSEESSRGWSFEWSWHELTRCSRRWGTNFLARAPRTWAQISSNLLSSYGLLQCIRFEFIDISTCASKKIYLELSWHNLDSSRPLYSLDSCVRICPNMSECCPFSLPRHETGLPGLEFRASKHLGTELTIDKLCWLMTLEHAMLLWYVLCPM